MIGQGAINLLIIWLGFHTVKLLYRLWGMWMGDVRALANHAGGWSVTTGVPGHFKRNFNENE